MLVNGNRIHCKDMAYTYFQMEKNMKERSTKESKVVKVSISTQTTTNMLGTG
jgi:hypothetical protein